MKLENNQEEIICVTSTGDTIDANIDSRFGRCQYFAIIKIKNKEIITTEFIKNTALGQGHGAGVNAAEITGQSGAKAVISGEFGPKAASILEKLGIEMHKDSGSIREAVKRYLKNL